MKLCKKPVLVWVNLNMLQSSDVSFWLCHDSNVSVPIKQLTESILKSEFGNTNKSTFIPWQKNTSCSFKFLTVDFTQMIIIIMLTLPIDPYKALSALQFAKPYFCEAVWVTKQYSLFLHSGFGHWWIGWNQHTLGGKMVCGHWQSSTMSKTAKLVDR